MNDKTFDRVQELIAHSATYIALTIANMSPESRLAISDRLDIVEDDMRRVNHIAFSIINALNREIVANSA